MIKKFFSTLWGNPDKGIAGEPDPDPSDCITSSNIGGIGC